MGATDYMLQYFKIIIRLTKHETKYVLSSYLDRYTFITRWTARFRFRTLKLLKVPSPNMVPRESPQPQRVHPLPFFLVIPSSVSHHEGP